MEKDFSDGANHCNRPTGATQKPRLQAPWAVAVPDWSITLPLIRPAMIPAAILGIIWTFNNFLAIYLITGGGPAGQTDILLTYIYRVAFLGGQFLYSAASAVAVIVFFILIGFVLLNVRITNAMQEGE